jgi:hypothetical protein
MSWHLQTIAKYGFVEETGDGRGRSRPWRLTSDSRSFETSMTDPDVAAAGEALERTFMDGTPSTESHPVIPSPNSRSTGADAVLDSCAARSLSARRGLTARDLFGGTWRSSGPRGCSVFGLLPASA